jgi:general secretion pathway protein G
MAYSMNLSKNKSIGPRPRPGFTLVEILIVVIILGILAAVVIPQFASASNDARKNALLSQMQRIRSQLSLYTLGHRDTLPPLLIAGGATAWDNMTVKTNSDHTTTGTPTLGPYLMQAPVNHLNNLTTVTVVTGTTDYGTGGVAAPGSAGGWVFNSTTGKIWATSSKRGYIYNERNANDVNNSN